MATALSSLTRSPRARQEPVPAAPAPGQPPVAEEPAPRARPARRPSLIAGGLALVAVCGLGGWALTGLVGKTTPVVVATQPFAAGHVIGADDVRVVELEGTPQIASVSSVDQVVGKVAAAPVSQGEALTADVASVAVDPDRPIIGISVKASGIPVLGLQIGDQVAVFAGGNSGGGQPPAAGATSAPAAAGAAAGWSGTVTAVGTPREDGTRTVDVKMTAADATAAAKASGGGDAVVVLMRRGDGK